MKRRKIPMRMCVGCKEMKPKKNLVRVVKKPDGDIQLDMTGKVSGRGAYVCKNESCLNQALKQKQLDRALEVTVDKKVTDSLKRTIASFSSQFKEEKVDIS